MYKKRQVLVGICTVWTKRDRVMYLFDLIGQKETANDHTLYTLCMYIVCWHRGCYDAGSSFPDVHGVGQHILGLYVRACEGSCAAHSTNS